MVTAKMTRRGLLAALAGAAVLPALAACGPEEDCDADDLLEGDEDCYGSRAKPKKKKSSKKTRKK